MEFTLEQIQRTKGASIAELIAQAHVGDRIVLYDDVHESSLLVDGSNDFYVSDQMTLSRNGETVFQGDYDDKWTASAGGFVVEVDDRLLANGKTELYSGEQSGRIIKWAIHAQGVVVLRHTPGLPGRPYHEQTQEVVLNGERVLHRKHDLNGLLYHPKGFLVATGHGKFFKWLLNGSKVFVSGKEYSDGNWNLRGDTEHVIYKDGVFLLNGVTELMRGVPDHWNCHRHGIVMTEGNRVSLTVLWK